MVGTPRVQRLSFSATGTPGERARVLAPRDRGVDRVGGGERGVAHHEVERVELGLARVDRGEVLLDDGPRRPLPAADRGRDRPRGHGASPRIRGTRNRPSSAAGRLRQHLVPVEARAAPRPGAAR